MKSNLGFFQPTGIGSLPHQKADEAVGFILANFSEVPFWPQLPQRDFRENMYIQYSEGLPGFTINEDEQTVYVDLSGEWLAQLESFYQAYLEGDDNFFAISLDYAQGFFEFLEEISRQEEKPPFLKGQVTGPVSFGLTVTDQNKRPIIYEETIREALVKLLAQKGAWQEKKFKEASPSSETVIFYDEPYLSSFGSAYVKLERGEVESMLSELRQSISGKLGVHCCGNTDWSLLLNSEIDILSFDAYSYSERFLLYKKETERFLERGGLIAWGIVPTLTPKPDQVLKETPESLANRIFKLMDELALAGIERDQLLAQSLLTPNCGTGSMKVGLAEKALKLTVETSSYLREKFGLGEEK